MTAINICLNFCDKYSPPLIKLLVYLWTKHAVYLNLRICWQLLNVY